MLFKNVASQKAVVFAYDKTTGAGKTGDAANITANVSKDGAAPAASNDVNPTEIGGGLYAFDLTAGETNCDLFALYAASATSNILCNPVIGYTTGGSIPQAGVASAAALNTVDDFLDTEIAAILAAVDTEIAAIKAKTDNLPASPAAVGSAMTLAANAITAAATAADFTTEIQSGLATAAALSTVDDLLDTEIAAIKAKTDLIPAAPAAVGDIPTATENADALLKRDWTSVTGEAARSVLNALRALRNKVTRAGNVYEEDDTTVAWTFATTTDAAAEPITEIDPS
jgi:hypothetical protein